MNKFFIVFFLMLALGSSRAQTTIDLNSSEHYGKDGYYYKDLNNRFNVFEGNWRFTSGNTYLEIKLDKKVNVKSNAILGDYFYDALVGEYKYVENGVLKINTMSNMAINHSDAENYNILATNLSKYGDLTCNGCQPGNIYVKGRYSQPNCNHGSVPTISFRHYIENGVHKLKMIFSANTRLPYDPDTLEELPCDTFAIPYGEYILVKQ